MDREPLRYARVMATDASDKQGRPTGPLLTAPLESIASFLRPTTITGRANADHVHVNAVQLAEALGGDHLSVGPEAACRSRDTIRSITASIGFMSCADRSTEVSCSRPLASTVTISCSLAQFEVGSGSSSMSGHASGGYHACATSTALSAHRLQLADPGCRRTRRRRRRAAPHRPVPALRDGSRSEPGAVKCQRHTLRGRAAAMSWSNDELLRT